MPSIAHLLARAKSYRPSSGGGTDLASLGAIVPIVMLLIFCVVFFIKHRKAKKAWLAHKIPYSNGKIALKAALIAVTFGLVAICIGDCCGCDDVEASADSLGGGGGTSYEPMGTTTNQAPPMASPGMDWTPNHAAAVAPIR